MIGDKLRDWGIKNFGSLNAFAKALDMSQAALSLYINNKRKPGTPILRKLQNLGCDINWLLSENDSPIPDTLKTYQLRITQLEAENERLRESLARLVTSIEIEVTNLQVNRHQKKRKVPRK